MKFYRNCVVLVLLVLVCPIGFALFAGKNSADDVDYDKWEAPERLKKAFPYYIAGLDYKGQPVFIFEFGKWNIRKYFESGGDSATALMYLYQQVHRFRKAERNLPPVYGPYGQGGTGKFVIIVDFDGYSVRQLLHAQSIALLARFARRFVQITGDGLDYAYVINVDNVAQVFLNTVIRPILGRRLFSKITSGTTKDIWVPLLLKNIPSESLPPWYGGSLPLAYYRPKAVYG